MLEAVVSHSKLTLLRPVSDAFQQSSPSSHLNPVKRIRRRREEMAKTCMAEEDIVKEDMAEEDIVKDDISKGCIVKEDKEDMRSPTCLHAGKRGELKDRCVPLQPSYGIPPAPVEEEMVKGEMVKGEVVNEGTSTYNYEQLDLTKQQIRLITLHVAIEPSDPSDATSKPSILRRNPTTLRCRIPGVLSTPSRPS